ncbi:MAG: hypothetical protein Q8O55_07445 [Dehalococcoidales bacterium]|nr:hypothetical protein [Dehalococcoidales bacterium]
MASEEIATFDECPVCGSDKRIGEKTIVKLKESGVLGKNAAANLVFPIPMVDQEKLKQSVLVALAAQVTITSMNIWWDICEMCGTMYCIRAEIVEQTVPLQMQAKNPFSVPPGVQHVNLKVR